MKTGESDLATLREPQCGLYRELSLLLPRYDATGNDNIRRQKIIVSERG